MNKISTFIMRLWLVFILFSVNGVLAAPTQLIKIAYISQEQKIPAALSNLDPFISNKGIIGAELAIEDNNTTGQFTAQHYQLIKIIVPLACDAKLWFEDIPDDIDFVIVNLPTAKLQQLADLPKARQKLFGAFLFCARVAGD